jgi:hypothetical protein
MSTLVQKYEGRRSTPGRGASCLTSCYLRRYGRIWRRAEIFIANEIAGVQASLLPLKNAFRR